MLERMRNALRRRSDCVFAALVISAQQFLALIKSAKSASIIGARNALGTHQRRTGTHKWVCPKTRERARASVVLSSSRCHLALLRNRCRTASPQRVILDIVCANRILGLSWALSPMSKKHPLRHGGSCVPFEHTSDGNVISAACRSRTQRKYVANAVTSCAKIVAASLPWRRMNS